MAGQREKQIIDAYEAWDPESSSVNELADDIGISRQRLYQVLSKHHITPKTHRHGEGSTVIAEVQENALEFLLRKLEDARRELAEYRLRFGDLD